MIKLPHRLENMFEKELKHFEENCQIFFTTSKKDWENLFRGHKNKELIIFPNFISQL